MHLARSCLNGLQKPYDPMVFLCTAGDAKKARHCLMIQAITRKASIEHLYELFELINCWGNYLLF
jgi:hypothetical protein